MKTFPRSVVCLLLLALCVAPAVAQEKGAALPRIIRKVLFVGDSITLHPPSVPLDWKGNWGMAASTPDKDYAHLFYAKVCAAQPEPKPELVISGRDVAVAGRIDQNLANLARLQAVGADLIVIQLGENEGVKDMATFEELYERLVVGLKGDRSPIILCAGVWSPTEKTVAPDAMIRRVCARQGAHFVPIAPVPPGSAALFDKRSTNAGVNWHPGDKGMQHYADALWRVAAPLLGGQTPPAPARASDGFEYQTEAELKAVWKIEGPGFTGPLKAHLNPSEAREGKKCLELILPPTKEKETARLTLDVFPKVALKEVKQIRFWLFVGRTKGIVASALYCGDKDWKNNFCKYSLQKLHEGWQKVCVSRSGLTQKAGNPSWDQVTQMRFSLWFGGNEPENRILLDEVVWDSETERPMNLNKEWYDYP